MQLWLFFWNNGMPPDRAVEWVLLGHDSEYDQSAKDSMRDLVKHTQTEKGLAYLAKFPVMNLESGRPI